jgi:hypothetical protein
MGGVKNTGKKSLVHDEPFILKIADKFPRISVKNVDDLDPRPGTMF